MKQIFSVIILTFIAFVSYSETPEVIKSGIIKYEHPVNDRFQNKVVYTPEILQYIAKSADPSKTWLPIRFTHIDEEDYKRQQEDSIRKYTVLRDYYQYIEKNLLLLLNSAGKKISADSDIDLFKDIVEQYATPKDQTKIFTEFAKGKISKITKKYIKLALEDNEVLLDDATNDAESVEENWLSFCSSKGYPLPVKRKIISTDTIYNPFTYKNLYKLLRGQATIYDPDQYISDRLETEDYLTILKRPLHKDWEWYIEERFDNHREYYYDDGNGDKSKEVMVKYPFTATYRRYYSHPQYCIINDIAYDKNGELIRVLDMNSNKYGFYSGFNPIFIATTENCFDRLKKAICAKEFRNNAYNIKSADSKTLHYVKVAAGLEKLTDSEIQENKRRAKELANGIMGSLTGGILGNSGGLRNPSAKSALNYLLDTEGDGSYYSAQGKQWVEQVMEDWKEYFEDNYPYQFERIDDRTIKVTYCDINYRPTIELTHTYYNTKPFQTEETIVISKVY